MECSVFIAAPEGTSWPLPMSTVAERLPMQLPGVQIFPARVGGASNKEYLPFQVELDGEVRNGLYVDRSTLILNDAPTSLWVDTIVWFLQLLPPGTPAVAMVEVNPEELASIPSGADAETIRALLDNLAGSE